MEKIGLLLDSTAITRQDLLEFDFVKTAQLKVQVEHTTYDEKDLTKEQMLQYLEEGKKFLTSQPSPAEFFDAYKQYSEEGYTHVFVLVLSHKVSGTYQSALIAKSMIDFDLEVEVHSPNSASFGIALGAHKIAQSIAKGASFDEITKRYDVLYKDPTVSFTLGSLTNLFRGGRLNRVQAFIGKILKIKPVIEMIDGKLELVKKERTNLACLEHFIEKIGTYVNKYKKVYLDIININMDELSAKLLELIKKQYANIDIHLTDYLSPVFYSHLGDKGFGIAIVAE
ncbi:MAG: DegV family protein [Bacilli bacterium]|nr:DegV family protein [Bacilli bacterium]